MLVTSDLYYGDDKTFECHIVRVAEDSIAQLPWTGHPVELESVFELAKLQAVRIVGVVVLERAETSFEEVAKTDKVAEVELSWRALGREYFA